MSDLTVRGIKIENLEKQVAELEAENERLKTALVDIAEGSGPFSRNPLIHAENTIEHMKNVANAALS